MEESFSTENSLFPVSAKSGKPESLSQCNRSYILDDIAFMNEVLRLGLRNTYDINWSTSQTKGAHSINSDSVWLPRVSSFDINGSHEGIDLSLNLALTLRVKDADGEYTAAQPIPPIAGGTEQATIVAVGDFQLPTPNRQDNNSDMHFVSREMVNAKSGFKRNYYEGMVGQETTVQCSAPVRSKKYQQQIFTIDSNEAKDLPISSNISMQTRPCAANHSGMNSVSGLCNLSQNRGYQLYNFDPNLTDADRYSIANIEDRVIGWPPIRPSTRSTLCPFPNPSVENQEGARAGSSVQGQRSPLYVKVKMDGKPVGRKVDLNSYESYEALVEDLNNMFELTSENYVEACPPMAKKPTVMPLRLLEPNADFIITYEDSEGDCMLVGDVPWRMFLRTVRRLRIKSNSGTNNFAQKCSKKRKST